MRNTLDYRPAIPLMRGPAPSCGWLHLILMSLNSESASDAVKLRRLAASSLPILLLSSGFLQLSSELSRSIGLTLVKRVANPLGLRYQKSCRVADDQVGVLRIDI